MLILNKHIDGAPEDAVYVGRGSALGNLKVIGKDGTREEVIAWYRTWLAEKLIDRDPTVEKIFRTLGEESKLLCFCVPKPCHAQVIAEYWTIVNGSISYEEGLKDLARHVGREVKTITRDDYRKWLVSRLISRHPAVCEAFRELNLGTTLIPEHYRHLKDLSDKVILPLYQQLVESDDFDGGINHLAKLEGVMPDYSPLTDGITHINIYSKGKTALGRMLTNFSNLGLTHPDYGTFQSVEGFWYWLATGRIHDRLRHLYGFQAKEEGKLYQKIDVPRFEQEIKKALMYKVEQNVTLWKLLEESTLPFSHYYYYGTENNHKIIANDSAKWFTDYLELLRLYVKGQAKKLIIAGSRSIDGPDALKIVESALKSSNIKPVLIVSGNARGIDRVGEALADKLGLPVQEFIPDWEGLGKGAGMVRNQQMGDYAGALLAVWDGQSRGTKQMIDYMTSLSKETYVEVIPS